MTHSFRLIVLTLMLPLVAACGDDGGPGTPSVITSTVSLTLATDVIRVGETTQASATATTSTGPQPVATGWQSDAPSVASVSPSGLVTGIAPGRATISTSSGGRVGSQVIRVNPNYQGQWQGSYSRRSCVQTGSFASVNPCGELSSTLPTHLTLTQSRDTVSGNFLLGTISFPSFTAPIDGAGSIAFTSTATMTGDLSILAGWRLLATTDGRLTGTLTQIWRVAGVSGDMTLESDLTTVIRVSQASARPTASGIVPRSLSDAMRALGGR